MHVATTFLPLLQVFAMEMTAPTFRTFLPLVAGWLLAPRRTILGMVWASGTDRHHAAIHRLFAAAVWSMAQTSPRTPRAVAARLSRQAAPVVRRYPGRPAAGNPGQHAANPFLNLARTTPSSKIPRTPDTSL
jgi:hypothetical protein